MQQVTDRVHVELGYHGSNNGVFDAGGGNLVLIDAPQLPADARAWAATVAELGTPRYLINTDHHPDHTVGNRWLDGVVLAHRGTRERLAGEPPSLEYLRDLFEVIGPDSVPLLEGYRPRLPDLTFDRRLDLWVSARQVVLLHAPGHTANTIMVHLPDEGVLFTGDNVCEAGLPAFVDSSISGFLDAIDLAARLDFEHLVPGHGAVAGPDVLDRYRELGCALFGRVADAQDRGAPREECGAAIRYEDRIHMDVGDLPDYPHDLIDHFQRLSIERIYDDLVREPGLRSRIR